MSAVVACAALVIPVLFAGAIFGAVLIWRRDQLWRDPRCMECGEDVAEVSMLHDPLWRRVAGRWSQDGLLHLGCAEKRLGRRIRRTDLTDAPCNEFLALGGP